MKVADLPIVFMSYDEPWADDFYRDLKEKFPPAKRVHGVKGLDACHKAAADEADSEWFITVDADTLVDQAFFDFEISEDFLGKKCRIDWTSRNVVNGLCYGNGSLKCWPSAMVKSMKTHEAAPQAVSSVDHDVGKETGSNPDTFGVWLPQIFSRTHSAETPFHAFRCGYREGVRLSRDSLDAEAVFGDIAPEWHQHRLRVWCSVGGHAPNGDWMVYGARLGLLSSLKGEWEKTLINDHDWFDHLWNDVVYPRFKGFGGTCRYTETQWDPNLLATESDGLAGRIEAELGFQVATPSKELSAFMAGSLREARSMSIIDMLGLRYLKGRQLPKDPEKAKRLFEVGAILNLSGCLNNLGRMYHLGQGVEVDFDRAEENYESAIALDNPYAPFHLATMLREHSEEGNRVEALLQLANERGFAPDLARKSGA